MSKTTKLMASVGSLAILGAGGTAHAAGTAAGTSVENTFTLDYKVGTVQQTQIDNTATPTDFTVDRVVDLTVTGTTATTANPGETGVTQVFTVTNEGNSTVAYDLNFVDDSGDDFDLSSTTITYTVTPAGGSATSFTYTPGTGDEPSVDVPADAVVTVTVTGTVGAGTSDGDIDNLVLVADTLEPTTAGTAAGDQVTADTGANGEDTMETVLNDTASATGITGVTDATGDGIHAALATVTVEAADITAVKTVALVDPAPASDAACGSASVPGSPVDGDYYLPGACIEYTITVSNAGSQSATDIVLEDVLSEYLTFISTSNTLSGSTSSTDSSTVGGVSVSGAVPTTGTVCTSSGNCEIVMVDGTLAGTATATPTTGVLRIRARVQ